MCIKFTQHLHYNLDVSHLDNSFSLDNTKKQLCALDFNPTKFGCPVVPLYKTTQEYLQQFNLMSLEDIAETFGKSYHYKNLKFENVGKSQLKM